MAPQSLPLKVFLGGAISVMMYNIHTRFLSVEPYMVDNKPSTFQIKLFIFLRTDECVLIEVIFSNDFTMYVYLTFVEG
jgi:hypothetical protein